MHPATTTDQPTREQLAALLARADQHIAAQGRSYCTEQDEDRAWRCAWNTWRTLQDVTTAVRSLLAEQSADGADVIPLHSGRPAAAVSRLPMGGAA